MNPKYGALLIALILALAATLVFVLLPNSANLTVAFVFFLIGDGLTALGYWFATKRNVPASYALIVQEGRFLPFSIGLSVIVLILEGTQVYTLPTRWHITLQILILAWAVINLVKVCAGKAYIQQMEDNVSIKRTNWQSLILQVEALQNRAAQPEACQALKQLHDVLQYADPISNDRTAAIENELAEKLQALVNTPAEDLSPACAEVTALVQQRNVLLKASK